MNINPLSGSSDEPVFDLPDIAPDDSGRLIGHCPEVEGADDYYCWKFENPDPNAKHDFWMMVSIVKAGNLTLFSQIIALDDGGYTHFVQHGAYKRYSESTFVQTIKNSQSSFGPLSISKLKVKTYYHGLQELFVGTGFRVGNFDANGDLVGTYTKVDPLIDPEVVSHKFPPFPESSISEMKGKAAKAALPMKTAIKLMDAGDYQEGQAIYFPTWEEQGFDDFVVDEGDELPQPKGGFRSIGAKTEAKTEATRKPGIHIEFTSHTGDPPHVASLFWYQPRQGPPRFLFGDYCSGLSYHKFSEHIFVKKKKSWFRTKTKITIIRKELIADSSMCGPIP